MNIQQRILLGPFLAVFLLVLFGGVAYHTISAQGAAMQEIKETRFEQFKLSTEMSERLSRVHVQLFGLVTFFNAYDKATQDRYLTETPKMLSTMMADFKRWESNTGLNSEEKKKLSEIAVLLEKYRKDTDAAINMTQLDVTSALGDMRGVAATFALLEKAFDEMNQLERSLADKTYVEAKQKTLTALWVNIIVLLLAIILAGSIGWLTARKLLQQLGGEPALAAALASRIASGDLTVQVPLAPAGSLLFAMASMRDGLRDMIVRMTVDSKGLSASAEQVAEASQQVARRSSEQNDAATSMAAAIDEMSVSISNVSDSAKEAAGMSSHSGATAREGASIVIGAAQEMQNIAGSVQDVSDAIRQLGQNARQISSVVTVIGEVANQTNLLALNAAIEAARAGEQGRGFAVVADEVRKLAERTTAATKEIGNMISAIQSSSDDAVTAMETAAKRVAHGVALANDAGSAIARIQEEAGQVLSSVGEISESLLEQGTVTQSIASHVERIARMSDDNNTLAGESASAASHLQELAHSMRDQVSRFRI